MNTVDAHSVGRRRALAWGALAGLLPWIGLAADPSESGEARRVPWLDSRVVGSPDSPRPYATEAAFTNLVWKAPLYLLAEPGTDRLVVVLQGGERDRPSRVVRVTEDPMADRTETLLAVSGRLVYGLTFHPGYLTNGHLYVFSNGTTGAAERTNRISRYTVSRQAPNPCDPDSEEVILEWLSSGHDGGDLAFGPDGKLYIATGDGTSDSDGWVTGQDLRDLAGGVLRIDVENPDAGGAYAVPEDNPFVGVPGARPELWAYGLRNPWRLTADLWSGQIWVGNNGQDRWETAHLVRRGENYGWSVFEGSHPFYLNRPRGPTPITPPTIEHSHADFRSLTGGVVYRGEIFPELEGVYVYGDYSTGKIWGGRHDGERLVWHRELADTSLQIAGFGLGHRGDLFVVDLGGAIHRLVRAPPVPNRPPFPVRLSETGLFENVARHAPHPALISYSINAPGWVDGASVERWIGLPGESRVRFTSSGPWEFPEGTVLMQSLFLGDGAGSERAGARRRIETRLLTRQQGEWIGYTYRWSRDQMDAELVESGGSEAEWPLLDSNETGAAARRLWRYPSRAECMACHSRAAGFVLGLNTAQLNRNLHHAGPGENQLVALGRAGVFVNPPRDDSDRAARLADPYDESADLDARARAYLHVNCSVCHVEAGGGNARMDLRWTVEPASMELIEARPMHDTFGLPDAMLVAPGIPERSVLYHRVTRRGPGRMPPLGSAIVDERGSRLMRDWIVSMPSRRVAVHAWTVAELEGELEVSRREGSAESGAAVYRRIGCAQCHRLGGEGGSVGPDLTGIGRRLKPRDMLEAILEPSKSIAPEYAVTELELVTGEHVAGRIELEDLERIWLRPVDSLEPASVIQKSRIKVRRQSGISNMPTGLADGLERGQVLDLIEFLVGD